MGQLRGLVLLKQTALLHLGKGMTPTTHKLSQYSRPIQARAGFLCTSTDLKVIGDAHLYLVWRLWWVHTHWSRWVLWIRATWILNGMVDLMLGTASRHHFSPLGNGLPPRLNSSPSLAAHTQLGLFQVLTWTLGHSLGTLNIIPFSCISTL